MIKILLKKLLIVLLGTFLMVMGIETFITALTVYDHFAGVIITTAGLYYAGIGLKDMV